MSAAASLIERQCQAALLKERLIPLVTLLGAILRKELRGEEQPKLPKDLALAWGQVAERLLTDSGFAAWERKAIARAAARFLDGCAGEIRPSLAGDAAELRRRIAAVEPLPAPDDAAYFQKAVADARAEARKVIGAIGPETPWGTETER